MDDAIAWMRTSDIDGEVIVVNDGSTDGTAEVLRDLERTFDRLIVVTHEENKGYGAALCTGFDRATKEFVAFMDSDGQFHAEDFDRLIPHLSKYDVVIGRRRHRADPLMRKVNAKMFGLLSCAVLGIWVRDINCAMKIVTRDAWQVGHPRCSTGALFNAELFYRLKQHKIAWHQVDVRHFPRLHGVQTGAQLGVILRMFIEMVKLRLCKRSA